MSSDTLKTSPPRVRFAPSPTGYLHIGGVRTALFNWLWARKLGGSFILRIEDTDQERSTEQSKQVILDSLRWLGLDWDEGPEKGGPYGPYFQLERLGIYREFADRLISLGGAYRCYCTKEELDAQRAALKARDPKATFRYPGTCRDREGEPSRAHVVRFRMREGGEVVYRDLVFGEIRTPNAAQQDFVLLRSDGVPLYNFGAVVDDIAMGITLVARGRDHMVNTPPQLLLYEALGHVAPQFAHLPMMLAQSGEKLSKRHGAVSVGEYRAMGYPPDAVLNYLARFGWSHGDDEIFSRGDLIEKFSWEHVGRADGKFDPRKFADVSFEHLKRADLLDTAEYARQVIPFLERIGISSPPQEKLSAAIACVRERGHTLEEAAQALAFFFRVPEMDEKAKSKFLLPAHAPKLRGLHELLQGIPAWDAATLETTVSAWLTSQGLSMKDIAQPARVALTGKTSSPGLYEMLEVLGKGESLSRLAKGLEIAEAV